MKFTQEIEIEKPIDTVVNLFDDPKNLDKWMDGLQSFEPLEGTPGHPGARSKLKFKMGKREIEMIETVTRRNLPHELSGTYEAPGVFNIISNRFVKLSDDKTKYIVENEFRFKGMMKLMGFLMPGAFKKQSKQYMVAFKDFVENQP